MNAHLRANLVLVGATLLLSSVAYPLAVYGVGWLAFRDKSEGSLIPGPDGKPVGSRLIAQEFKGDEYFQPRPSAASYNASASSGSNWGANNPKLRDRVAQQLGPIVKYRGGPKKGQLVDKDIEAWFQADHYQDKAGIVAQWADLHSGFAQDWVKKDPLNAEYVTAWQNGHKAEVAQWMKEQNWVEKHPDSPEPKPEDLAPLFFTSFSATYPGAFPDIVETKTPAGETEKRIEPVMEGTTIQSIFFDMWLQDHKDADLEPVPADMVMASGSGLDPDISLKNALYQLDRVAAKWAELTGGDAAQFRKEIEEALKQRATAPFGGLAGPKLVNVLEINLLLNERYAAKKKPAAS